MMKRLLLGTMITVVIGTASASAQDALSNPPAFAPVSVKGGQIIRLNVVCFEHEVGGFPPSPCRGEFMFHDASGRDIKAAVTTWNPVSPPRCGSRFRPAPSGATKWAAS